MNKLKSHNESPAAAGSPSPSFFTSISLDSLEHRLHADRPRTVVVEPVAGYSAVRMTWQKQVELDDVHTAFRQMVLLMDAAPSTVQVIVDIRRDPLFPVAAVVTETLTGPARHVRMGEWLVIGSNRLAELIGNILVSITRRKNIHWFKTEAEALAYLNALTDDSAVP